MSWFPIVSDLEKNRELVRQHRYGVIEVGQGELKQIRFRPWPKLISAWEVTWLGNWNHQRGGDPCLRLYFNQPWRQQKYLVLSYADSTRGASFADLRIGLRILDLVAWMKQVDAIVTEIRYPRISEAMLTRVGWERHLLHSRQRHFIKRFYGDYSAIDATQIVSCGPEKIAAHRWAG
jgi:hypothetical protein